MMRTKTINNKLLETITKIKNDNEKPHKEMFLKC